MALWVKLRCERENLTCMERKKKEKLFSLPGHDNMRAFISDESMKQFMTLSKEETPRQHYDTFAVGA